MGIIANTYICTWIIGAVLTAYFFTVEDIFSRGVYGILWAMFYFTYPWDGRSV